MSRLMEIVKTLHNTESTPENLDIVKRLMEEFSRESHRVHDQTVIDYQDLTTYGHTIATLNAVYITSALPNELKIITALRLRDLMHNDMLEVFMAYAMKLAILIYRAEELEQKQASSVLNWIVAPEPTQQAHPNSDQPAPPPDGLPAKSEEPSSSPAQD